MLGQAEEYPAAAGNGEVLEEGPRSTQFLPLPLPPWDKLNCKKTKKKQTKKNCKKT